MGFAPQLPVSAPATRSAVSPMMQEKSQAIPFLKKPAALDGALSCTDERVQKLPKASCAPRRCLATDAVSRPWVLHCSVAALCALYHRAARLDDRFCCAYCGLHAAVLLRTAPAHAAVLLLLSAAALCCCSLPLLSAAALCRCSLPLLLRPAALAVQGRDGPLCLSFCLAGSMAGDIGFDPLEISALVPLNWSREAELKHARVCMLAVAGWVAVDLGFRVPFAPAVSSLYAHDACVEKGPMLGLFGLIAVVEVFAGIPKCFQLLNDPDAAAGGDYKFDPLGFGGGKMMEEKELANGRIAMLAFSGIVTQAQLTGGAFPYTYNGVSDLVPPLSMTSMPGFGS